MFHFCPSKSSSASVMSVEVKIEVESKERPLRKLDGFRICDDHVTHISTPPMHISRGKRNPAIHSATFRNFRPIIESSA